MAGCEMRPPRLRPDIPFSCESLGQPNSADGGGRTPTRSPPVPTSQQQQGGQDSRAGLGSPAAFAGKVGSAAVLARGDGGELPSISHPRQPRKNKK